MSISLAAMVLCSGALAADIVPEMQGWGSLRAIRVDGHPVPVRTEIRVAKPGWSATGVSAQWSTRDVKFQYQDDLRTHSGRIAQNDIDVLYRQQVTVKDGRVHFSTEVEPQVSMPAEGMYLFISVPAEAYAGGEAKVTGGESTAMPLERPERAHFLSAEASGVELSHANQSLSIHFDKPRRVTVQDDRVYNGTTYSLFVPIHSGELKASEVSRIEFSIAAKVEVEQEPVAISLDPSRKLYDFHGFGGSFVYGPESPVSQYNLDNMQVSWGRVWLPLHEWEPVNDNDDPAVTDMAKLAANDKPGSKMRHALEISRDLERRKIPYIASIWPVPGWMLEKPIEKQSPNNSRLAREMWDELAESIGSYLLYAREQYGSEPEMFSFNEPDWGVTVKLTPEEHRDMIKLLGAHFQKLGLKTRMLGADVTNPRGTDKYFEPTLADPEAMKYVDAIAFHSWGGASPEQYAAWGELAQRAKLPLFCTEAGLDAQAWRMSHVFREYWYGHGEAKQYMEMLTHARPQMIMLWEYTEDYGFVRNDKQNPPTLTPTKRFFFLQQFSNSSAMRVDAVGSESSRADVLVTAFREDDGRLTVHLLNDGARRPARISGLPAGRSFDVHVTDRERDYAKVGTLDADGEPLNLAAWSLVTLIERR